MRSGTDATLMPRSNDETIKRAVAWTSAGNDRGLGPSKQSAYSGFYKITEICDTSRVDE